MRLRADFAKREVVRPGEQPWEPSPALGVQRMMLDRIGDEVARATSFVRFAPNAEFPEHVHGGGEEFFVVEGAFGDEHSIYPVGTYVRNPIGTSHRPKVGPDGARIFVKLHQFHADDRAHFTVDTQTARWHQGDVPGVEVLVLHEFQNERVALQRFGPEVAFNWSTARGQEILVLEGMVSDDNDYPVGTWIRNPPGSVQSLRAGTQGAQLYVKVGHLP